MTASPDTTGCKTHFADAAGVVMDVKLTFPNSLAPQVQGWTHHAVHQDSTRRSGVAPRLGVRDGGKSSPAALTATRDRGSTSTSIPSNPWPWTSAERSSKGRSRRSSASSRNASAIISLSPVRAGLSGGQGTPDHSGPRRHRRLRRARLSMPGLPPGFFSLSARVLRLDSHGFSPAISGKIVRAAARNGSFAAAAESLNQEAEITISGRQVGRIAHEVGGQLQQRRDQRVEAFREKSATPEVTVAPRLAAVFVDGGRLRTRDEEAGRRSRRLRPGVARGQGRQPPDDAHRGPYRRIPIPSYRGASPRSARSSNWSKGSAGKGRWPT